MIINTNQPHPTKTHNGLTRQEREERAAAAVRHRQLDALRALVRASMAGMDETPADPAAYRQAGLQADATWEAVEGRKTTGKRQIVKGRSESGAGGNKHAIAPLRGLPVQPRTDTADRTVADVLRTIITAEGTGKRLTVVYHDGEREPMADALPFLIDIISKELRRSVLPHEVNAAASHVASSGDRLPCYGI